MSATLPAAVIFDMDGLMLDTEGLYHAAWQEAATELGYNLESEMLTGLIGIRTDECEKRVAAALDPDGFPLAEFRIRWEAAWLRLAQAGGIACKPGLLPLLDLVDRCGIPKAVATSSTAAEAARSLSMGGIANRFAVVVSGDQVENGKPAPDIFLEAARRLNITDSAGRARTIAFEDSDAGAVAAARAGMSVFIVPDLKAPAPAAAAVATAILESLHDAVTRFSVQWESQPAP